MNSKFAIINTQSTFNSPDGREALDLALIFAAYDQQVTMIFVGDGAYQLISEQQPELLGNKDYLSTMKVLQLYDVEQLVCSKSALSQRGIDATLLSKTTTILSDLELAELLQTFDQVVTL